MLSMSLDAIESKANLISLHLKDINTQFDQPVEKLDVEQAKTAIKQLIEEMYELDDMVHEPSYQHDCLIDYWTLTSLHNCWAELKGILELLGEKSHA